ncbi:MAG: ADP-ribosylglycohydrolase family protein [Bacillota bacterium]
MQDVITPDVIKGAFYGAAVGDALGGPAELLSAEEIREKYGVLKEMVGGGWLNLEPGEYTDDTQMIIAVAKGILANPYFPVEEIGRAFIRWYQSRPKDIGNTTLMSFRNYLRLGNWPEAAKLTAKTLNKLDSNGGLMRTLPVTFGYWGNLPAMAKWAAKICTMTHYSQEGVTCCIFYNILVYLAGRRKTSKREMVTEALHETDRFCKTLDLHPTKFFWHIIHHIQKGTPAAVPRGNALDTLAASLQSFLNTDSFEEALVEVVNRGDDTDTAGTVTGGLAGAYYGYPAIPSHWLAALKNKPAIDEIIEDFSRLLNLTQKNTRPDQADNAKEGV